MTIRVDHNEAFKLSINILAYCLMTSCIEFERPGPLHLKHDDTL